MDEKPTQMFFSFKIYLYEDGFVLFLFKTFLYICTVQLDAWVNIY